MTQAPAEVLLLSLTFEQDRGWTFQIAPNERMEAYLSARFSSDRFVLTTMYTRPRTYRVNADMLWMLAPHFSNFEEMHTAALRHQARWQTSSEKETAAAKGPCCATCGKDLSNTGSVLQGDTDQEPRWFCLDHWCITCKRPAEKIIACPRCGEHLCSGCRGAHGKTHAHDQAQTMHRSANQGRAFVKDAFGSVNWGEYPGFDFAFAAEPVSATKAEPDAAFKKDPRHFCDTCQQIQPQSVICSTCDTCPAHPSFCPKCWRDHLAFHEQLKRERARKEGRCLRCQLPAMAFDLFSDGLCTPCVRALAKEQHRLCEECGTIRQGTCTLCHCGQYLCEMCSEKHFTTQCYKRRCTQCQKPLLFTDPAMPDGLCVSCLRAKQHTCEQCARNVAPAQTKVCQGCQKRLCSLCEMAHIKRHLEEETKRQQQEWIHTSFFEAFFRASFTTGGSRTYQQHSTTQTTTGYALTDLEHAAFQTLGIAATTDTTIIKKAYKALIRTYHPDGSAPDPSRAVEINKANDVIERWLKRSQ